ncbi:hypothetical protein [Phocaeicola dorei]|uniref:hypothetical protein n=1 Tax=Phocaeicola dorei TaxID=357276 RepID=UPI0035677B27
MEQKKNEPTKENKAAPDAGKPKKEREPLTEAQRLKRQKMIVGKSSVSCPLKPSDSAPLKHSTMPP